MSTLILREFPLELRFSTSQDREEDVHILRLAGLLPGLRWQGDEAVVTMALEDAATYRDILFDLWEQLKNRPGAGLALRGEKIKITGLKQAFTVLECAGAHEDSATPDQYCHPIQGWDWGCLHLRHVAPDKDGSPALLPTLDHEVQKKLLYLCPFFDRSGMEKLAAKAPVVRSAGPDLEFPIMMDGGHKESSPQAVIAPTRYSDIGGLDEVIRQVRESVELPLRHPEVIARLGITPPRGVLLYGPPGCGKTMLARAVAHESGLHFMAVSGPELITKWHGESEDNLRKVFAEAREKQPCIVFFDEIDAIAQSRSSAESLRLDARFTTQLLVLLDGIHDPGQVFVIGTTNRLDLLDPALLRPGRFDRIIAVPRPDRAARLAILNIHARKLPLGPAVHLARIVDGLEDATGADIAFVVREAAHRCLRRTMGDALLVRCESLNDVELAELEVDSEDFDAALHALRQREASLTERGVALFME
jgi:AAA+ superfamily predicted ATPase